MVGGQEYERSDTNSALDETEPHPMEAYMLYFGRMCEYLSHGRDGRSLSIPERNQTILNLWNDLSPEMQRFWFLQAKEELKERSRKPQQITEIDPMFVTSETITSEEDNLQTPKPVLNNAPLFHPRPSKLLKTPTLSENWSNAEKGKKASTQTQNNGNYAIEPGSVPTPSSSTKPTSPPEYVGGVHCLPEPCMKASLGPDSLLLQEFDYKKSRARMDASKSKVNSNNNLPSTSSGSGSNVNNVHRK